MILMFGSFGVKAQETRTIDLSKITWTYTLHGEPISPENILKLYNVDTPFHCAEITGKNQFACFDTVDESIEFALNQVSAIRSIQQSCGTGHWTYYFNTGWNTVSHVLNNGQSNNNHAGIWSALTTCTANATTIWKLANQGGGVSFTYTNSQWALIGFPFGGGGGKSSKVD